MQNQTQEVFLSGGSNLGDRLRYLMEAEMLISQYCGRISDKSPIYETASWGSPIEPDHLNIVWKIETTLNPITLLAKTTYIENYLGRVKSYKWAPRVIDIDILFYADQIINNETLIIPHPYIQERKFCLVPLQYIAALKIHPVLLKTITQLNQECKDNGRVEIFENNI